MNGAISSDIFNCCLITQRVLECKWLSEFVQTQGKFTALLNSHTSQSLAKGHMEKHNFQMLLTLCTGLLMLCESKTSPVAQARPLKRVTEVSCYMQSVSKLGQKHTRYMADRLMQKPSVAVTHGFSRTKHSSQCLGILCTFSDSGTIHLSCYHIRGSINDVCYH